MRLKLLILLLLLIVPMSFSATCYQSESYCSKFNEYEYNCRDVGYSYPCQKNGPHLEWKTKTCKSYEQYSCKTRTGFDICINKNYINTIIIYKECWHWEGLNFKKSRHSSCGIESQVPDTSGPYTESYKFCNPHPEKYDCGWSGVSSCTPSITCRTSDYDCSGYETVNGPYSGTCYGSNRVCDKATDYSKCDEWSERMIPYDCSKMKLSSYSLSNNFAKIGDPLTASFYLENCEGSVHYTFNIRGLELSGITTCNNTNINFAPVASGTQTIILTLKDNYLTLTKSLGALTITNQQGIIETQNPFTPMGEQFTQKIENGNYDAGIIEWITEGLSNEEILLKLMITFGAAGLAITATQANRIKDYLNNKKNNINTKSKLNDLRYELMIQQFSLSELVKERQMLLIYNQSGTTYVDNSFRLEELNKSINNLNAQINSTSSELNNIIENLKQKLTPDELKEYDIFVLDWSKATPASIFYGIAGIDYDEFAAQLDAYKLTFLPTAFIPGLDIADNICDFAEFIANLGGIAYSLKTGKYEYLGEHLTMGGLAGLGFVLPFLGDSLQALKKSTKLARISNFIGNSLELVAKRGDEVGEVGAIYLKKGEQLMKINLDELKEIINIQKSKKLITSEQADKLFKSLTDIKYQNILQDYKIIKKVDVSYENFDEISQGISVWAKTDDNFSTYISEIRINPENSQYLGVYDEKKHFIELAFKQTSSADEVYELMIHEGGHAMLANSQVYRLNINGYETLQASTAIDKYFKDTLEHLKTKYKNLYNQMHDTAVNKISLTNPNVDINKWYKGFKEDYSDFYKIFEDKNANLNLFDKINNHPEFLPELAEIKLVLKAKGDLDNIKIIDTVMDLIKYSDNSFISDDFNKIYKSYEKIYEGIK